MKKSNKEQKAILFMAQLPPPVHGAALRNQSLLESVLINTHFKIHSLPLRFTNSMQDLGTFSFKKVMLMILHCARMAGILLTKKIDIVYFTMSPSGGSFYRDLLFMTIIKVFRKKRILHFRVKGIKATSQSRLGKKLIKYAFKGSEIVCLSKHHMEDVIGFTYNTPYIVPNGIKVETSYLDTGVANSPHDGIRILFLSNLSVKKGVRQFIGALKLLHLKGYQFSATLVGDEWDMTFQDVQELIDRSGLSSFVELAGPKYGKEKFDCLHSADIFAFPTYFELFPGVVLEAMQFGKAIVSTFEGSIPEMIDNDINGLLVEPESTTPLADAIALLIDNKDLRLRMSELAQQKFFQEFTLEAFENKMKDVFNDVLQK